MIWKENEVLFTRAGTLTISFNDLCCELLFHISEEMNLQVVMCKIVEAT